MPEKEFDIKSTREKTLGRTDHRRKILIICGVLAAILFLIGILNVVSDLDISLRPGEIPVRRALNFMTFGLMVLVGPYGFYVSSKQKEIKEIERRLPDFLRDVAEAGRFGMTLADAIVVSSAGRYGKLTPEIKKMSAQIQWGVPVTHALNLFAERVNTPMTNRIVSIINKSSEAGGNVADVLTMVSTSAKETQLSEDERAVTMKTYLTVIMISFFVFLVTIWILNATFLPKMLEASSAIVEAGQTGGGSGGLEASSILASDLEGLIAQIQIAFFLAAVIHALGDGILAGVLENGSIANGMKYSFIMLISGFLILEFLA
jgi:flagellar protein FlaJ